jgi:hypothetical protein
MFGDFLLVIGINTHSVKLISSLRAKARTENAVERIAMRKKPGNGSFDS